MLTIGALLNDIERVYLPCQTVDPEIFFAEWPTELERAKELCADCPLRRQCLEGALARREAYGVWGGQLVIDGVIVPRKRGRGRPRKADIAA